MILGLALWAPAVWAAPCLGQAWRLLTLNPSYLGEQQGKATGFEDFNHRVRYLTAKQRKKYEVHFKNGRIFDAAGKPFQTTNPKGSIFVRGPDGIFYASNDFKKGVFHHSSFLRGQSVLDSEHIWIVDGRVTQLHNFSGHYSPSPREVVQTLLAFKQNGLDISQVKINLFDGSYHGKPVTEKNILNAVDLLQVLQGQESQEQIQSVILVHLKKDRSIFLQDMLADELTDQFVTSSREGQTRLKDLFKAVYQTSPSKYFLEDVFQDLLLKTNGEIQDTRDFLDEIGWSNDTVDAWLKAVDAHQGDPKSGAKMLRNLKGGDQAAFREKIRPYLQGRKRPLQGDVKEILENE